MKIEEFYNTALKRGGRVPFTFQTLKSFEISCNYLKEEVEKTGFSVNDLIDFRKKREVFREIEQINGIDLIIQFYENN
jgi:hypothetical protein